MRRRLKTHPQDGAELQATLVALSDDAFQACLFTHKLKGKWSGYWACTVGYDFRIVFEFVAHKGAEAIRLHTLGTHNEVY